MAMFLMLALPSESQELTQEFSCPKGQFVIFLPESWVEIPLYILENYTKTLQQLAPTAEKQEVDYGYQLSSADRWLTYPYIFVQVHKTGRFPEKILEKFNSDDAEFKKYKGETEDEIKKYGNEIGMASISINDTVYDPALHIVWSKAGAQVKNIGRIQIAIAMILTEQGTVTISVAVEKKDFESYALLFERIIKNIKFDEGVRYQPKASGPKSIIPNALHKILVKVISAIIIFVVVVGFQQLWHKRTNILPHSSKENKDNNTIGEKLE